MQNTMEKFPNPYAMYYNDFKKYVYYTDVNNHKPLRDFYESRLNAWQKVLGFKIDLNNMRGTLHERSLFEQATKLINACHSPWSGMMESSAVNNTLYEKFSHSCAEALANYQQAYSLLAIQIIQDNYGEGLGREVTYNLLKANGYKMNEPEFYD